MKKVSIQPEKLIEEISKIQNIQNVIFHISSEVLEGFITRNKCERCSDYNFGCHSIILDGGIIIGYENILKGKFTVITRISCLSYNIPDILNLEEIYIFTEEKKLILITINGP